MDGVVLGGVVGGGGGVCVYNGDGLGKVNEEGSVCVCMYMWVCVCVCVCVCKRVKGWVKWMRRDDQAAVWSR